jgi:hypothetical protein
MIDDATRGRLELALYSAEVRSEARVEVRTEDLRRLLANGGFPGGALAPGTFVKYEPVP